MGEKGRWCCWKGKRKKLILVRMTLVLGPKELPFRDRCGVGKKLAASNVVAPLERMEEVAHPEKGEAGPGPRRNTVLLKARGGNKRAASNVVPPKS